MTAGHKLQPARPDQVESGLSIDKGTQVITVDPAFISPEEQPRVENAPEPEILSSTSDRAPSGSITLKGIFLRLSVILVK